MDLDDSARQNKVTSPSIDNTLNTGYLTLNLARRVAGGINRAVEPLLTKVIAPERLTPLFLLAMYGYFESRLESGYVEKAEQPFLTGNFMPALLDSAALMLLDKSVAGVFDATGAKLIETLVFGLLRARYGTEYRTLMAIMTWRDSMRTYANMLRRLDSPMQKQGIIPVEGTRDQTMRQLNLPATTFDTIASNFPDLIEIVTDFKKAKVGAVRFRLHPLESSILEWLSDSPDTITAKDQVLHRLNESEISTRAQRQGYREAEVTQILTLMRERELIYDDGHGAVIERPSIIVTLEEVAAQVELLTARVELIRQTFPEATEIRTVVENTATLNELLRQIQRQRKQPDPKALALIDNKARDNLKLLDNTLHSRLEGIKDQSNRIVKRYSTLKAPGVENLGEIEIASRYAEPLEQARSVLVDRSLQAASIVNECQTKSEEVTQQLINGDYSQDVLPEIVAEVRRLEEQFDQLATDLISLSGLVVAYSTWTRIISLREILSERVVQLGREGSDIAYRLERLDSEIAAAFARDWQAVLSQGDMFERRLKSLDDSINEIENRTSNKFLQVQNSFLSLLRSANCPEEKLWSPIVFSQTELQRVHEQLWSYAGRATIAAIDHAEDAIQQLCSELRRKLASPDRERILDRANALLEELSMLTNRLPYSFANDPRTIREFDGTRPGGFSEIIDVLREIWEIIEVYHERVTELGLDASEIHLAPLEAEIISYLKSDAPIDLGIVWGYLESPDSDAVWSALRALWEKGAIQVRARKTM